MFNQSQKIDLRNFISSKKEKRKGKKNVKKYSNTNKKNKIPSIHKKRSPILSNIANFNRNSASKIVKMPHKLNYSLTGKNDQLNHYFPKMSLKDIFNTPQKLNKIKENIPQQRKSKLNLSEKFLKRIKIKRINESLAKSPLKKPNKKSKSPSIDKNYSHVDNSLNEPYQIKEYVLKRFKQSFTSIDHINSLFKNLLLIGRGSYAKAYLADSNLNDFQYVLKTFEINSIKNVRHFNRIMVFIKFKDGDFNFKRS